jgi:hypothetical protein
MVDRMALAFSLALFGATIPICALAESEPTASAPALTWDAPATCQSGDLIDRVADLVGLTRDRLAAKLLRVEAEVTPTATGGWQARLRIETVAGSGERSFSAEDCSSLVDGAALILALTVDPSAASARMPVAPARQPAVKPASPPPRFLLRPLLAADLGVLPDVALAYGVAVGVAWPSLRFEVDGSYQSPQRVADGLGHSGRVRMPLNSGVRACVAPWLLKSIEPAGCLGAGLAWLRSSGEQNIALPETHDTLSVAVTAGAAVGLRLRDWLWLRAEASLGLMARRPKLQILTASQGAADVYSVRWLTARVGGGLEFRL